MTVELPWKNNKVKESCITPGEYQVTIRNSPKYGKHYLINNVKGRDLILIHVANFTRELLGCIGVGLSHKDIDGDGLMDNVSSKIAMDTLLYRYGKGFRLVIE